MVLRVRVFKGKILWPLVEAPRNEMSRKHDNTYMIVETIKGTEKIKKGEKYVAFNKEFFDLAGKPQAEEILVAILEAGYEIKFEKPKKPNKKMEGLM